MVESPSEKETRSDKSASPKWGAYIMGLSPVWVLVSVMVIYGMVYSILIQCVWIKGNCLGVPALNSWLNWLLLTQNTAADVSNISGFAGRINWSVATGLNLFLSILTLVLAGYIAMRAGCYYPYRRGLLPFFLFGVSIAVGLFMKWIMSSGGGEGSPWENFIHVWIFRDLSNVESWTRSLDAAGVVFSIYLALSVSALLCAAIYKEKKWPQDLASHTNLLNVALYVGALFLVVGVLRIATLFEWSLAYIEAGAFEAGSKELGIYTGLSSVAKNITRTRGVLYTMILAAFYLPAAVFMRWRAVEAREHGIVEETQLEGWLQQWSFTTLLPRFIAVLSPALSGPAADYLQLIG